MENLLANNQVSCKNVPYILKEFIKHKLLVFGMSIFRRIFDPNKRVLAFVKIKYNTELNKLNKTVNVINHFNTINIKVVL